MWARWIFGTLVHHLLGLLASQIKSLFLAPTVHLSNLLASPVASSISLDLITEVARVLLLIALSWVCLQELPMKCSPIPLPRKSLQAMTGDFIPDPADQEPGRLMLQKNHHIWSWMPEYRWGSFKDQKWVGSEETKKKDFSILANVS